jgi:hypothetical protein
MNRASEPEGAAVSVAPAAAPAPAMLKAASAATPGNAPPPVGNTAAAAPTATPGVVKSARPEMLDIEANLTIEVESVGSAAAGLRALARRFDGIVTEDRLNQNAANGTAQLTIRVPSGQVDGFFEAVGTVGRLLSRQINARDIGKDYFDAEIRLENLQNTMHRYEEILKQAKNVDEILRIESELGRLRGEIEQTKGNLRWLSDRAARATVHISLVTTSHEITTQPSTAPPEAKFYPGLRLVELSDFRGEQGNTSYLGGGVSATFTRAASIQLDILRESGKGSLTRGLDVALLTLGGEMYSDFLGGGKRKFLNPYLGYALGYARFTGHNEAVIGATLGLELVKLKPVIIDLDARALGLFFGSDGSHFAIEPVLSVSVPF